MKIKNIRPNPNPLEGKNIIIKILKWNGSDNYEKSAKDIIKFVNAVHNDRGNKWATNYFKKQLERGE